MPDIQGNPLTLADLAGLNYTILVPYNGSIPTGGDSLNDNLNIFYTVSVVCCVPPSSHTDSGRCVER